MKAMLFYAVLGYLSGGVLYAEMIPRLARGVDVAALSQDRNPGAFNVFEHCGVSMGLMVLACDILKAFVPVYIAVRRVGMDSAWFALVLAAPVIGHAFPVFSRFRGGKGIAAAFGALMGLWPFMTPLALLAG